MSWGSLHQVYICSKLSNTWNFTGIRQVLNAVSLAPVFVHGMGHRGCRQHLPQATHHASCIMPCCIKSVPLEIHRRHAHWLAVILSHSGRYRDSTQHLASTYLAI